MIRPATMADLAVIMEIFELARRYMRQTGNMTQWSGGYPQREIVQTDIEAGNCYVMVEDGVCAVFSLFCEPDETYAYIEDGDWGGDEPYGTIHRIASNGAVKGVVAKAVAFANERHNVLRCDTHIDNLPMQKALQNAGFARCGRIYLANGEAREAYIKR